LWSEFANETRQTPNGGGVGRGRQCKGGPSSLVSLFIQ
jgi:hypothetical protein